jgi:ATP-dependent RNA helicase DeaD
MRQIESLIRQPVAKSTLPTEEDIKTRRENELLENVKVWLTRARYRRERELVARLVEEGHDPLEIAAAALKLARADEKQRPIAAVGEVQDTRPPRTEHGGRRRSYSDRAGETVSHEPGMVRLSLNMGRTHGIRPNDIVGTIAFHADIPGNTIGKIHIQDQFTLVDVPEKFVPQVLARNGNYRIRQHSVSVKPA